MSARRNQYFVSDLKTPIVGSRHTSISSRRKCPIRERRRRPSGWACCDRHCMRESGQRALPISNAQAIVGAINVISMAIGIVDLVDDLSTLFRPETEAFNCDAVDQEEVVAYEAYWWSFGAVG